MLLYSCTFLYKECAGLYPCCIFYGLAACATSSSLFLFFSTSIFEYSYLKCLTPQHLKHLTSSTISFLLILTFSLTPHLITLLNNTSNLFWGAVPLFSFPSLFLQFQARCPNPLQLQHSHFFFPSNFALNEVRVSQTSFGP